jgi:hypothetical protein
MFCLLFVICFAIGPSRNAVLVYLSCYVPPSCRTVHLKQKFDGTIELSRLGSINIRWWIIRAWTPDGSDLCTVCESRGKHVYVLGWERFTASSDLAYLSSFGKGVPLYGSRLGQCLTVCPC